MKEIYIYIYLIENYLNYSKLRNLTFVKKNIIELIIFKSK